METLHFSIDGEFVTNLARIWFWDEEKDYEVCEELLLNCMGTDEISLERKKEFCQQIIEGRYKLVGVNQFHLEADNEEIHPITEMIQRQKKRLKIKEIEENMELYPIQYVDIYATVRSYKSAEEIHISAIDEIYKYFAGKRKYPWQTIPDDFEPLEAYNKSTKCGLWLLERPELVYELIKEPVTDRNKCTFFKKLYEYLETKENLDPAMKERQLRYEAEVRIKREKERSLEQSKIEGTTLNETATEMPDKDIEHMSLKEYDTFLKKLHLDNKWSGCLPDEIESDYGIISPDGDYYSCDFGGHNIKAYYIICGRYYDFGYSSRGEAEINLPMDNTRC